MELFSMRGAQWTTSDLYVADFSAHGKWLSDELSKNSFCQGHIFVSTSGTTATDLDLRKWVGISKKAMLASAASVNKFLNIKEEDIWFQCLPLTHVGGLAIEARAFLTHSEIYQWREKNEKWSIEDFYESLRESSATLTSLVPTQVFDLVQKKYESPRSLRAAIVGGAWLPEDLYLKARELGWPLLPSFGMSEVGSQLATASLASLEEYKYPFLHILPHVSLKTDEEERLYIKSAALFSFYIMENGKTVELVKPPSEEWFKTEDRVQIHGLHVHPLGRVGDVFKIAGELVSLHHLERIFQNIISEQFLKSTLPDMAIAIKNDERLGHAVELFVVKGKEKAFEEVQRRFDETVRPFERIRKVNFVDVIPRSELGKILRNKL